ncbi:tetratricopeptide repeat protein [Mucilaginibacter terrae]|uniref:tetratricopeptide repeat protein n=1 Tax=Mucilaginibacter terrae TaxID=1955052 RepID=UPI003635C56D
MKITRTLLLVLVLLLSGNMLKAQKTNIDSLRQRLKTTLKDKEKFIVLSKLNAHYMLSGDIDSLKYVTKAMLRIAQHSHNDTLLVHGYLNIANYLVSKADFEASLEFYFKALHLAEDLKLTQLIILINNNIGGEYEDLKNFNEALKYTRRTSELLAITKKDRLSMVFNNWHIAYDYLNMNNTKPVLDYLNKASQIIKEYKLTGQQANYIQAHIFWTYGQAYQRLRQKENAVSYFKKAITFSDSLNLKTPLILSLNSYSEFLYENKLYKPASLQGVRALSEARKADYVLGVIQSAAVLSKIYSGLNIPDSANYYYRLKDTYQEKAFNQQRISRLQDITFTEQIHQAEEQARQNELEEQRKHNIQYAAIAIAIISFVVMFLLLSRSTLASPRLIEFLGVVGLLILFEFINLLLHPFIGKYTHHSPLLMLGIMVGIAALLVPMHHRLEGWIKHKFIGGASTH